MSKKTSIGPFFCYTINMNKKLLKYITIIKAILLLIVLIFFVTTKSVNHYDKAGVKSIGKCDGVKIYNRCFGEVNWDKYTIQ